jgi:hypothetical protein
MEKIKRLILINVPMSICNFRCSYCYLTHRKEYYQDKQPDYKYSPEHVAKALSVERLGGKSYINFCADGETLLAKNIDKYVFEMLKAGHYVEFVTNLSVTPILNKFLSWDKDLLKRLEFKCSFHYLQLKEKGWLDRFAQNVQKIWDAGASANIEITPSDELIPYLDEVKEFSIKHFGALPQLSIARRDNTKDIDYLTDLSIAEYDRIWSSFDSGFWNFKKTIFKEKRKEFCYAGDWSININLATGITYQCYKSVYSHNVFENIAHPIKFRAIGRCLEPHCYNGHMLLSLGCIPNFTSIGYGDIRNRIKSDSSEWLQPELKDFFNSKLHESNDEYSESKKKMVYRTNPFVNSVYTSKRIIAKIKDKLDKSK